MYRRLAVLAILLVGANGTARAGAGGDCTDLGALKDDPSLAVATIKGPDRVPFLKNISEDAACPAATDRCHDRAFLVSGNVVVTAQHRNGFTCAQYMGATGGTRTGWLPDASLAAVDPTPTRPEDWLGTWVLDEGRVTIKAAKGGKLALHGDATWGMADPERVKRGAVNVGSFDAVLPPGEDGRISFDTGDKGPRPVTQGDDTDCKIWLRRIGRALLVDDNSNCGGMNVRFSGSYQRQAR